jgi:hypothetical protein
MAKARPAAKKKDAKPKFKLPGPDAGVKALMDEIMGSHPDLRPGNMFGCPGYFVGKKSVGCVFGAELCLTLPPPRIDELVGRAGYRRFEAMGRTMSGWILLDAKRAKELARDTALVEQAIAHARSKA